MRYVLIAAGALGALVVLILAVGWLLPVKHRAVRQAAFHATPAQLFALITAVEALPSWRPSVQRVELLPEANGHRRYREIGRDGGITFEIVSMEPDRGLVTRIADPSLPFGGGWTFELIPASDATTLRITEDGEVYNPIFRFVSRFVMGHQATIDAYLRDVGTKLGNAAVIETPTEPVSASG